MIMNGSWTWKVHRHDPPTLKSLNNLAAVEERRVELEAHNLERRTEAEAVAANISETTFVVVRQAGESGQLYGSVQGRDVVEGLDSIGLKINRDQVVLKKPIKTLGLHQVQVKLHPEVQIEVIANIARSDAEAERQAAGEDVLTQEEDDPNFDPSDVFEAPLSEEDKPAVAEDEGADDKL